ncbi:restriction endonuclease subunit S [Enterococcus cecorum]|uniref:restriction endonuclease subunit S n=2 Tax=Enterococcus cecorum TaxID=44008 RepID=UPI002ACA7795|nr:restriction endonuclease subunit S [Enterococcus cecorum]MDZ5586365.1 restriction endonuclease subunit S [Enterococcus cecorum]
MNEKKKLQPKVRFRGFTGKNAPDWEQRKLGEITERVKGNDGRMDLPTLTISASEGWLDQRKRFSSNIAGKEQKNYTLLKKGQLSYNHGNSKLAKYGVVYSLKNYEEALVPRVYHSFTVNSSINSDFIELVFATKLPDRELGKLVTSGARMDGLLNINYDDFMGIVITIPKIDEQKRIRNLFNMINKLITLHQRKLEQLEELKNTLLSKMFPKSETNIPEIRFSGFTDAWKQRKLGEMSTSFSGGTPTVGVREYYNGEIPFIRSAEIGKCKTELYISKLGLDNSSARLVSKGDILYAMYGATSGEVARSQIDGAINQAILVIKPVQSVDSEYITQWLRKNKQKIIKTFLQGGQGNLSASIIKNLKVYFPTIEEQQKIGNVFNSFDRSLKFHLNRINELKCLKNNLLNKMFI